MKRRLEVLLAVMAVSMAFAALALAASSPSVVTGGVSKVTETTALLHGTVNPNGSGTTYYFQWGLSTAYGATGNPNAAGSGTKPVGVEQTASGLIPGTTYHYRLLATNRDGTTVGADRVFTTAGHPPPDVATGPATGLSSSAATLTGVVNPHGQDTTWTFQYDTTTAYRYQTLPQTVGASSSPVNVAFQVQGLRAATIFHYRLVATHGTNATSYGADGQFMTYPLRRPVPRVRASTRPGRDRHRPFTFTTRGSVSHPGWIPAIYACSGNVSIRFFHGSRQVGVTFAGVQPNCTFSAQTTFRHLPGRGPRGRIVGLAVRVGYLGNGYLAPRRAGNETVILG